MMNWSTLVFQCKALADRVPFHAKYIEQGAHVTANLDDIFDGDDDLDLANSDTH